MNLIELTAYAKTQGLTLERAYSWTEPNGYNLTCKVGQYTTVTWLPEASSAPDILNSIDAIKTALTRIQPLDQSSTY